MSIVPCAAVDEVQCYCVKEWEGHIFLILV